MFAVKMRLVLALFALVLVSGSYSPGSFGQTKAEFLEAIEAGNELVKKNPDDFSGYASRGCGYEYLKRYDLAERDFLKAISLSPSTSEIYIHLAAIYNRTKQYEKAASASRKAVELGSHSEAALNALLVNLCLSKKFGECLTKCDEVIRQFPGDGIAYYLRAICKSELGGASNDAVLSDLAKATALRPKDLTIRSDFESVKAGRGIRLKMDHL